MKKFIKLTLPLVAIVALQSQSSTVLAQSQIYPQHFNLEDVTLLDSPFKKAMDKNIDVLMDYDVDRLLTPFVRQAGLSNTTDANSLYFQWENKHPNFVNWCWNPSFALDGHVGGHYLSALALAYAACHDEDTRMVLKARLDYMVNVLKDCQEAMDYDKDGLKGFIGGLPDNSIWTELYKGNPGQYQKRGGWVPFYCMHKTYAGLRDAYIYAGNKTALTLYRNLCDWGIALVEKYDDQQMAGILGREHGGMNEVYADAFVLFKDVKYLRAAEKYSHKEMVDGMQDGYKPTFLDNKHANTQVPKYIGFERVAQIENNERYKEAAYNFWEDVVNNRTVCIGGNSVGEHFLSKDKCSRYITHSEGPESCNTNNMLKLSEDLFDDTHDARYSDFYEKATLNHILSTQDPNSGGYVYFTSLRPESYRIYSTVNEAMWCCVGTGMENHSKYGHFIYSHSINKDTVFVNQFIASELNDKRFKLKQETDFPYSTATKITVNKAGYYSIALRHPAWTTSDYNVRINGKDEQFRCETGTASYVTLQRRWKKGDVIELSLPMELTYSVCPNYEDYVAFQYGPVLLAAQTTSPEQGAANYEQMQNEYADDSRMGHSLSVRGKVNNLAKAPMLIGQRKDVLKRIKPIDLKTLTFSIDASAKNSSWGTLELKPFYTIHNARYVVYWNQQTEEDWKQNPLYESERKAALLEARTLDQVGTGEQQSEAGHTLFSENSGSGSWNNEAFRDAKSGGWFQYTLSTNGMTAAMADSLSLMCRFTVADRGRVSSIYIDNVKWMDIIIPEKSDNARYDQFYNVEYAIPAELLKANDGSLKKEIKVKFVASGQTPHPGLYYLRLVK